MQLPVPQDANTADGEMFPWVSPSVTAESIIGGTVSKPRDGSSPSSARIVTGKQMIYNTGRGVHDSDKLGHGQGHTKDVRSCSISE